MSSQHGYAQFREEDPMAYSLSFIKPTSSYSVQSLVNSLCDSLGAWLDEIHDTTYCAFSITKTLRCAIEKENSPLDGLNLLLRHATEFLNRSHSKHSLFVIDHAHELEW